MANATLHTTVVDTVLQPGLVARRRVLLQYGNGAADTVISRWYCCCIPANVQSSGRTSLRAVWLKTSLGLGGRRSCLELAPWALADGGFGSLILIQIVAWEGQSWDDTGGR